MKLAISVCFGHSLSFGIRVPNYNIALVGHSYYETALYELPRNEISFKSGDSFYLYKRDNIHWVTCRANEWAHGCTHCDLLLHILRHNYHY
jgi:hypothetical protein